MLKNLAETIKAYKLENCYQESSGSKSELTLNDRLNENSSEEGRHEKRVMSPTDKLKFRSHVLQNPMSLLSLLSDTLVDESVTQSKESKESILKESESEKSMEMEEDS